MNSLMIFVFEVVWNGKIVAWGIIVHIMMSVQSWQCWVWHHVSWLCLAHHPWTKKVIFFWPMGVSVLKRSVSMRCFQGYQSYNRFMEGKWGFWPSECKFWVKKSHFLTKMPYQTQWNPKESNLLPEKINLHLK